MIKADLYTKVILTVIAVNLTILTVKNLGIIPEAYANKAIEHKEIALPVNYGIIPLNEDGSVSVRLKNAETIDVNITGIKTIDELDINIDEVGGRFLINGGAIPVKIVEE